MLEADYYDLLGVKRSASLDEIRQAYKRMLRQVHPDRGGSAASFRLVQHAWETLSDPQRRRDYDSAADFSAELQNRMTGSEVRWDGHSRRGYSEESERAPWRERQQRMEREAREQYWRGRAAEDAARVDVDMARAASGQVDAERAAPYYRALRTLAIPYQKLHMEQGVALTRALALNRLANALVPLSIVTGAIMATIASLTGLGSSDVYWIGFGGAFARLFASGINFATLVVLGVFVAAVLIAAILWIWRRALPRRPGVSENELIVEYLRATGHR